MDIPQFKKKLHEQGVTFELYCERVYTYSASGMQTEQEINYLISMSYSFYTAMLDSFNWLNTPEGNSYWMAVANEVALHLRPGSQPQRVQSGCDCGGDKCNTGHSFWCSAYKEF